MSLLAWIVIAAIFLIIEVASLTLFYACFVLGAILAGVSTFLTDSVTLQGLIFVSVSAGLILLWRILPKGITGQGQTRIY